MATSTALETANKILGMAGQSDIPSATAFDTKDLNKAQYQTVLFMDLANRLLSLEFNTRFNRREFSLNTAAGTTEYALSPQIALESITYKSFRNETPGNAYSRPLGFMSYEDWKRSIYDETTQITGAPTHWIPLPSDGSGSDFVRFYPDPDNLYNIKYRASLDAVPLTTATQQILWPVRYEHILWMQAREFLEQVLGEGKAVEMRPFVMEAIYEVLKHADGPMDEVPLAQMTLKINTGSGYNDMYHNRRDWIPSDES